MRVDADRQGGLTGVGRTGVFALVLLAVLGRAIFLALPVNSDTAMFVYAGKLVAEGGRPGVDLLDNKLPTVGLMMSVPWQLFGGRWTAYAAIGLLLSLGASWFLWRAARDVWGSGAAVVVGVASVAWLNFPPGVYGQLQLETIQVFFASVAAATTLRLIRRPDWRDALLVGLCGGTAAWAKPTGLAVVAAAALTILFGWRGLMSQTAERLRSEWSFTIWRIRPCHPFTALFFLVLGVLVPIGIATRLVVDLDMADALPETVRQLRDYAHGSTVNAMDLAKPATVLGLLGFPLLVLGVICRRDRRPPTAVRLDVVFVALWFAAELIGIVMQRRMYAYHFLPLGPPAAMAVGLLARRVSLPALAMAFGPVVAATVLWTASLWQGRAADARDAGIIAYLGDHAARGDAVWADDYPRLLVETGRRPGSAVPLIFLMANGDTAPDFFGRRLLADLAARRPAYVVFAADPKRLAKLYRYHMNDVAASPARADAIARQIEAIAAYIAGHYHPVADFGTMRIWRR